MSVNMELIKIAIPFILFGVTQITIADGNFKRFSVSAGWLHAMPQGKANPFNINTIIGEGTTSSVGSVSKASVLGAMDPDSPTYTSNYNLINGLSDPVPANLSGTATVNGLSAWQVQGSGLEADDVDTVGLLFNYHITDHVSLELKAGIPPKVNIKGVGEIHAPFSGTSASKIGPINVNIDLKQDIHVTDLTQGSKATTARAWLPAMEVHYQFGQTGVNKFRPYIGAGIMYAYFNDIKLNQGIESDLIAAGHMIQNIFDNKAGAALDGKESSADPRVKVEATDGIAPIVTVGATYDFNQNWFAVGSLSYAKMNNEAKVIVLDNNTGTELIRSKTKIDIAPIITYPCVGYRF